MKKAYSLLLAVLMLGMSMVPFAASATVPVIEPGYYPPQPSPSLFGQMHYYNVLFRGNDEAVVFARLVVPNLSEKVVTEIPFSVAGASIADPIAFQQQFVPTCVRNDYRNGSSTCAEYSKPNYAYNYGSYRYQPIKIEKLGNSNYVIKLAQPIQPNETAGMVLSYLARGYVKNSMGLKSFEFQTLKMQQRINLARVAVNVDVDMAMKGKRSDVNYNQSFGSMKSMDLPSIATSPEMDNMVSQIGYRGVMTKEAQALAPQETLVVRGEYASSALRLHLNTIIGVIVIIAVIVIGIWYGVRILKRRAMRMAAVKSTIPAGERFFRAEDVFISTMTGLLSAVLVTLMSMFIWFLGDSRILDRWFNEAVLAIMLVVIFALCYLIFLIVPVVIIGVKRGWKAAIATVVAEVLWLILFVIIGVVFMSGVSNNRIYF